MDPFTQALLGAAVGYGVAGRRLGRRAALWGAVAGAVPDLDMLFGRDFFTQLRVHRGVTHALWFGPVMGSLWAWLYVRWRRRRGREEPLLPWLLVFTLSLLSHPLLDVCTPYGTQLLAPFSDARFAWHAVPVIEPGYTLILIAGLALGWRLPSRASAIAAVTIAVSSGYLGWGWWLNQRAVAAADAQLAGWGISAEVNAFPVFFRMAQRRIVAFTDREVWVGFVDGLDPGCIAWDRAPRDPSPWVDRLRATREGETFSWFTSGIETWTVSRQRQGWLVEISDLRYGNEADARRGIWGVRALFDDDGRLLGAPYRHQEPLAWSLRALLRQVHGGAAAGACAPGPKLQAPANCGQLLPPCNGHSGSSTTPVGARRTAMGRRKPAQSFDPTSPGSGGDPVHISAAVSTMTAGAERRALGRNPQ